MGPRLSQHYGACWGNVARVDRIPHHRSVSCGGGDGRNGGRCPDRVPRRQPTDQDSVHTALIDGQPTALPTVASF